MLFQHTTKRVKAFPSPYTLPADSSISPPSDPTVHPVPPTVKRRGKARAADYIPRPPNMFVLYRQALCAQIRYEREILGIRHELQQHRLSQYIAEKWNKEPVEVKEVWKAKAEEVKRVHKEMYPNYRYSPLKKQYSKKQKKERVEVEDAEDVEEFDEWSGEQDSEVMDGASDDVLGALQGCSGSDILTTIYNAMMLDNALTFPPFDAASTNKTISSHLSHFEATSNPSPLHYASPPPNDVSHSWDHTEDQALSPNHWMYTPSPLTAYPMEYFGNLLPTQQINPNLDINELTEAELDQELDRVVSGWRNWVSFAGGPGPSF